MQLSRMDLDETGSPAGLVTKILKAEPSLIYPVPIEELAIQLDIVQIEELGSDGFEGGLITDDARSSGIILVNRAANKGRRRFTIAHELGHFLIPTHKPKQGAEFMCSRSDMRNWSINDQDRYARMEAQANEFAALILMPPLFLRREMARFRDPNLDQIIILARVFDVSKEAAARAFAQYNDQPIAIIVAKDGRINRIYRNSTRFPSMAVRQGDAIPAQSRLHTAMHAKADMAEPVNGVAEAWLESNWGRRLPDLYEQVHLQRDGFALIMLWVEVDQEDEEDPDEGRTSKQRLQNRLERWNR